MTKIKKDPIKNKVSYSIKFGNLIRKVKDGSFIRENNFYTRVEIRNNTPDVLLEYVPSFKNLPMAMDTKHIKSVTGERVNGSNTHCLTEEQLAQIPDKMDYPIAVFKHIKQNSTNMVLNLKDSNGRNIIVAIRPNSYQRCATINDEDEYVLNVNLIKTIFGIGDNGIDINRYINDNIEKYYYPEDMTNKKLLQLVEGENLRHAGTTSINSLSLTGTKNNDI